MAAALLACTPGVSPARSADDGEAAARLALVRAVRARMGEAAVVTLDDVKIVVADGAMTADIQAGIEPGARLGRPTRFPLSTQTQRSGRPMSARIGYILATVNVAVSHARTSQTIARGSLLAEVDLSGHDGDVGELPVAPLPVVADLIGARVLRDLQPDTVVTAALARVPPLVRSGDTVRTRAIVGDVEVTGVAVAQQSGYRNDRIRLVNPESRRVLTGVVTGAGEVEVIRET